MKRLTLEPDEHMRWIYDPSHQDYNSDRAKDLRERTKRQWAVIKAAKEWHKWLTMNPRGADYHRYTRSFKRLALTVKRLSGDGRRP